METEKETIAMRLGDRFGGLGTEFSTRGIDLQDIAERIGEVDQLWDAETTVYTFSDGSKLYVCGAFWDLEDFNEG